MAVLFTAISASALSWTEHRTCSQLKRCMGWETGTGGSIEKEEKEEEEEEEEEDEEEEEEEEEEDEEEEDEEDWPSIISIILSSSTIGGYRISLRIFSLSSSSRIATANGFR